MRTAEEILKSVFAGYSRKDFGLSGDGTPEYWHKKDIEEAINEARIQLLIHIADKTDIEDNNWHPTITKEDILKLIDQIK